MKIIIVSCYKIEEGKNIKVKMSLRIPFCGMKQSVADYFVIKKRTPRNDMES